MRNIQLKTIELPDFGYDTEMPPIPAKEFEGRINKVLETIRNRQLDFLLVFADREHFANFRYLIDIDPRFEEALLLINKDGKRKILLGNECLSAGGTPPIPFEFELYQEFSLLGQDRSRSRSLELILREFGIEKGKKVGCAYFKYFYDKKRDIIPGLLDIPAYIADILRALTGGKELVINSNDIFMEPSAGLRHHNCLEELVRFEWASTRTSESMKNVVRGIKPERREYELAGNYVSDGLPYSCHPMLSSGEKAKAGLSSPSANKVTLGDPFTAAFGVWGALTCRAGMVAEGPEQLDDKTSAFYEKFWRNYFLTTSTWYESIGIGVTGGDVFQKAEAVRDPELYEFALNTGHSIHLDEWVNSPFYPGSEIKLHSGLALQMDIIPVVKSAFVAGNMEDGIVLADEALRNRWQKEFPGSWKRIQQRRDFMIDQIGIQIKPEVLPLSNIPAFYTPYLLSRGKAATFR